MANPLIQPGLIPGAQRRYLNYASYYDDPALDPYQGEYRRILERLDPEVNNAVTPVMLLEQALGSSTTPQAYLCCAMQRTQVRIYCIHVLSRYMSALDGTITPWDGLTYAFLGDAIQGTITTVEIPATAFRTILNVRAKTSDYIVTNLDTIGDKGLPAILVDEPEATLTSSRQIMYLPYRYASLMLNPAGYTLKQAWELLYPAIVASNDLVSCAPLLKWLRLVTMGTPTPRNANEVSPTNALLNLQVPIADQDLVRHRQILHQQNLPALFQPSEQLELAITQMAAAVTQNTNDNRVAREEKAARAIEPKLPSDKYTVTLNILLDYLETADETLLPSLWHRWANCQKRQEFSVLTNELQAYSRGPDTFSSCTPIVSLRLLQDLQGFIFVGESLDDIKTGIQPFIVADGSAEHRQANLELSRTYGLINSGEQSLLLADLESLKAKEVQSIPLTYFELERNLGMFGNLLGTVLGTTHVLTTTYRAFWTLLSQGFRQELQQIIDIKGYVKPTHLLRSVQLVCYNWFTQKRSQLTPPRPDFTNIIYNITLNTYVLPHLPPSLYKLAYPRPTAGPILPMLDLVSLSDQSGSTGSPSTASAAASLLSGITLPTVLAGARKKGSFLANLAPDASIISLVDNNTKVKDLIGDTQPPLLDNGSQICLSFLVRQGCWSTCRRANTHAITLNANEKARVINYLKGQKQKLNNPTSGPAPQVPP